MASGPGSSMQKLSACRKRSSAIQRLLVDEDAVHQRDLAGRAAEGQHADFRPDGEGLFECGRRRSVMAVREPHEEAATLPLVVTCTLWNSGRRCRARA